MMKNTVVVSLGGSTLYSNGKFDSAKARRLAPVFSQASKHFNLVIVVGGGVLAQKYSEQARKESGSEFDCDLAAIGATHVNARKMAKHVKGSVFVRTFAEAVKPFEKGKILFSGGMMPGMTTDSIAVLYAEFLRAARVVNVSNVDGIYSADPKKNSRAKKFSRLTHEQLVALAAKFDSRKVRENFVFDLIACKLAARSKIPVYFVSADPEEIERALFGWNVSGTLVR